MSASLMIERSKFCDNDEATGISTVASPSTASDATKQLRIAIVGGGLSGGACAYFLRQQFPNQAIVELTVFEKTSEIEATSASAATTFELDGRLYETMFAHCAIHPSNLYMRHLVQISGLKLIRTTIDTVMRRVCVNQSSGISKESSARPMWLNEPTDISATAIIWNKLHLYKYFGLFQLSKLRAMLKNLVFKIGRIYHLQENSNFTFTTFGELAAKVFPPGPLLEANCNPSSTLRDLLVACHFADPISSELADAACMSVCGQHAVDLDAPSGLACLLAANDVERLTHVAGGCHQVAARLRATAQSQNTRLVWSARVRRISRAETLSSSESSGNKDDAKVVVTYEMAAANDGETIACSDSFDFVLVACTLRQQQQQQLKERSTQLPLDFDSDESAANLKETTASSPIFATFVKGVLRSVSSYNSSCREDQETASEPRIRSVRTMCPCDEIAAKTEIDNEQQCALSPFVYKLTSEGGSLRATHLERLFQPGFQVVCERVFQPKAHKYNTDQEEHASTRHRIMLDADERTNARVFYAKAISDGKFACTEMTMIGARNAAMLVGERVGGRSNDQKQQQRQQQKHKQKGADIRQPGVLPVAMLRASRNSDDASSAKLIHELAKSVTCLIVALFAHSFFTRSI